MKRVKSQDPEVKDQYVQYKRILLREGKYEIFHQVCMQYFFLKMSPGEDFDSLIFVKSDQIFTLNYESGLVTTLMTFSNPLGYQPEYFCMDSSQKYAIVATEYDSIWFNLETG
jgi:hypothetical protein